MIANQVWVCDYEGLVVDTYIGKESPDDWMLWTKLEDWNALCELINPENNLDRFQLLKAEEIQ